jgi:hypothetical protein
MTGKYTFAANEQGRWYRARVAEDCLSQGFDVKTYEGTILTSGGTYTVYCLEVTGRRQAEGQIAADMKARKA